MNIVSNSKENQKSNSCVVLDQSELPIEMRFSSGQFSSLVIRTGRTSTKKHTSEIKTVRKREV
jgi:hypothetical protein